MNEEPAESDRKIVKEKSCDCCRFFRWNERNQKFECRRNAPRWNSGSGTGCTDTLWPEVTSDLWCGDWIKSDEWIYA